MVRRHSKQKEVVSVMLSLTDICRWRLISLLEGSETFSRFLDLPPEIRGLVYDHYFDFNPHHCIGVRVPPPVTEVNRLVRAEALPQFWSFRSLSMVMNFPMHGQDTDPAIPVLDEESRHFFCRAPKGHIEMVRSLHVKFEHYGLAWQLELARGDKPVTLRRVRGDKDMFDGQILEFLRSIGQRPDSPTFRRMDGLRLENLLARLARRAHWGDL